MSDLPLDRFTFLEQKTAMLPTNAKPEPELILVPAQELKELRAYKAVVTELREDFAHDDEFMRTLDVFLAKHMGEQP